VVKGVNFGRFCATPAIPVEAAIAYDAAGADELCFLDITATHEKIAAPCSTLSGRTAEACFMPLTVGGGGPHGRRYQGCCYARAADKVSINSAAVSNREFVKAGRRKVRRAVHRGRDRTPSGSRRAGGGEAAGRFSPMADAISTGIDAIEYAQEVVSLGGRRNPA